VAKGIRAGLTVSEGRRFGVTVGTAFLVFAAIAWWCSYPTPSVVLASLGGTLALAGLIIPTQLGPIERGWMALARAISNVTTPIVMGAMYLLVLTPVGLLRCRFGGNPLVHDSNGGSYWRSRPENARRSANISRQF
jgi:Saxitoxin biosynthesis operon protein SxtJ